MATVMLIREMMVAFKNRLRRALLLNLPLFPTAYCTKLEAEIETPLPKLKQGDNFFIGKGRLKAN